MTLLQRVTALKDAAVAFESSLTGAGLSAADTLQLDQTLRGAVAMAADETALTAALTAMTTWTDAR